jgi:hypothetical protein
VDLLDVERNSAVVSYSACEPGVRSAPWVIICFIDVSTMVGFHMTEPCPFFSLLLYLCPLFPIYCLFT